MAEITRTSVTQTTVYAIRCAILAVFVEGFRQRNPGAVVNAVLSLAVTYLPGVVERLFGVEFHPWQRIYAGIAMFAHAVGMLGPYDDTWWWDHLTHTLSATLIGGVAHTIARRRGRDPRSRVLAVTVGVGGLWELAEYAIHVVCDRLGFEPILVHYSQRDSLFDLLFDLLGALVVITFGDRLLSNLTRRAD